MKTKTKSERKNQSQKRDWTVSRHEVAPVDVGGERRTKTCIRYKGKIIASDLCPTAPAKFNALAEIYNTKGRKPNLKCVADAANPDAEIKRIASTL